MLNQNEEMKQNMKHDFSILARKALQLKNRAKRLRKDLPEKAAMLVGEQLVIQYNKILHDTKEIIYCDNAFTNTLDHLPKLKYHYSPSGSSSSGGVMAVWPDSDNTEQIIAQVRAGLSEIEASLSTFTEIYLKD